MSKKRIKLCFAASSGGHFEQLMMLKPLMNKYDSFVVTEKTEFNTKSTDLKTYYMNQVNRKEIKFIPNMIVNSFKSLNIMLKEKPDVVICTGVLAMIPLCLLCKFRGGKLIYIESFAKVTSPTLTGKFLYKYADQFYVQWETMKEFYPKAIYLGVFTNDFHNTGITKFQFNRLLIEVDKLISEGVIKDDVFAQVGYSDYHPINFKFKDFLDRDEFSSEMKKSSIVITHGGTGAIIGAVKNGKKVIAVPRLAKYGEHVDDHQLQIIKQFDEMNLIEPCYKLEDLGKSLKNLYTSSYNPYSSNTSKIIHSIEEYLITQSKEEL